MGNQLALFTSRNYHNTCEMVAVDMWSRKNAAKITQIYHKLHQCSMQINFLLLTMLEDDLKVEHCELTIK